MYTMNDKRNNYIVLDTSVYKQTQLYIHGRCHHLALQCQLLLTCSICGSIAVSL